MKKLSHKEKIAVWSIVSAVVVLAIVVVIGVAAGSSKSTDNTAPPYIDTTFTVEGNNSVSYPIVMNSYGRIFAILYVSNGYTSCSLQNPYGKSLYFNYFNGYEDFYIENQDIGTYTLNFSVHSQTSRGTTISLTVYTD